MDLKLKAAGFALLAIAALVLPSRRGRQPVQEEHAPDRGARLRDLRESQRTAQLRWIALAERDSVLARPPLRAPGGRPALMVRGFSGGIDAQDAEARVEQLWEELEPADSTVLVAVEVYNHAGYEPPRSLGMYWGTLIQRQAEKLSCTAIVPGEVRPNQRLLVGKQILGEALAPCLLFAKFGTPGSAVAAWLETTHYTLARSNAWFTRPAEILDGHRVGPWRGLYGREASFGSSSGWAASVAGLLAPPYHFGTTGLRCIVGDAKACTDAVLRSAFTTARDVGLPSDLTPSTTLLYPADVSLATIRPPQDFLLSDLIRDKGRVAFARFWKSQRPLEAAFADAFRETLGEWTTRWAKRQWRGSWYATYRNSTIILGTNLRLAWFPVAIFWTIAALLCAAWAIARKQVA